MAEGSRQAGDDLDELLAFYDFPAEHWIHLKTSNAIESTFSTVRLRTRLPAVLHALYLIFNEGYAASAGPELVRAALCEEAVRLARILQQLRPGQAEINGLLALFLLVDARRTARVGSSGVLIPFEEQDRTRWDPERIAEGRDLVVAALQTSPPGRYAVEAAIAAVHAEADSITTTDWVQVAALYDLLLALCPSPVVQLNKSIAIALRDGPEAGLTALDALQSDLRAQHLFWAARADLLRRAGRWRDAEADYRTALTFVTNERERQFLRRKVSELASLRAGPEPASPMESMLQR